MSDFDLFDMKLSNLKMLKKKTYKDSSCLECCDQVPSLKLITIATDKNMASIDSDKWHIDIQLRTRTKLTKWKLRRREKISLEDFL